MGGGRGSELSGASRIRCSRGYLGYSHFAQASRAANTAHGMAHTFEYAHDSPSRTLARSGRSDRCAAGVYPTGTNQSFASM